MKTTKTRQQTSPLSEITEKGFMPNVKATSSESSEEVAFYTVELVEVGQCSVNVEVVLDSAGDTSEIICSITRSTI